MRIRLRIAQLCRDPIFEAFRDEMLQSLGLAVNLIPGVIEDVVKKTLEQAMVTKHF